MLRLGSSNDMLALWPVAIHGGMAACYGGMTTLQQGISLHGNAYMRCVNVHRGLCASSRSNCAGSCLGTISNTLGFGTLSLNPRMHHRSFHVKMLREWSCLQKKGKQQAPRCCAGERTRDNPYGISTTLAAGVLRRCITPFLARATRIAVV